MRQRSKKSKPCATLCYSSSWCGVVLFSRLVWCLFYSNCQIRFDQVQIQTMILALSTLQIWKHEYFRHYSFIIFVGILPLYVINLDAVSLFTDSSFTVFSDFEFVLYDVFYDFE
ncbi:hypothetical protein QL285_013679 [Trifolium repens]|nr:hypothetical protein QL285_013679 [Trifolium repens]